MIFDIQHFSLHDGPGVRSTVFFKGCPLSCKWCSNPESQYHAPEILYYQTLCTACGACVSECPQDALSLNEGIVNKQNNNCQACGQCTLACRAKARTLSGRRVNIHEVCSEVREHWRIFMQSGGGVTCSGGEALAQPSVLKHLLAMLHEELGFHTCLDTTGYTRWEILKGLLPHLDLILLDIKHMDESVHIKGTGVSNVSILHNAAELGKLKFPVIVRLPLIPRFNDQLSNLEQMGGFLKDNGLNSVEIMPYHQFGLSKYSALQMEYQAPLSCTSDMDVAVRILKKFNLHVTVHGEESLTS